MKLKNKIIVLTIVVSVLILNLFLVVLDANNYKTNTKINESSNSGNEYVILKDESVVTNETDNNENIGNESIQITEEQVLEHQNSDQLEELKVYDGLTLEELVAKINKNLNSTISNKGYLIASYSLEKGVDPYIATAIILQETGCKWDCSYLVKSCNNVGGQKGTGCGSYSYFPTLDEGIKAFIDNLYNNYVSVGLTTPELMNPKYAESNLWSVNVNKYIEQIKAQ